MSTDIGPVRYFRTSVVEVTSILSVLNQRDRLNFCFCLVKNLRQIISHKRLLPAERQFMSAKTLLQVRTLGRKLILYRPELSLVRELYGRKIYFPAPEFIPAAGAKVIDLGANFGLFSLLCASLGAEVLAIDAQSGLLNEARRNFDLNQLSSKVRYINALIGSNVGVFASVEARGASTHWGEEPREMSMSEVVAMFGPTPSDGDRDIHLLKLDIEGSEFDLLDKDISWLRRIRHISMEVHPQYGDSDRLKSRLEDAGFACELRASWREDGSPKNYPGYLFASATSFTNDFDN